jgi:hypothetical protein
LSNQSILGRKSYQFVERDTSIAPRVWRLLDLVGESQSQFFAPTTKNKFKLKGTGPMTYHLGYDFTRNGDNVLVQSPKKYLEWTFDEYTRIFGEKPCVASSPLEKGDHPEIDTTEYLGFNDIKTYRSVIGSLQWVISLGRFNIATPVMTLSAFCAVPRKGHLECARRVIGYLYKMRHGALRYRTQAPDFSDLPETNAKWDNYVYGNVKEVLCLRVHSPRRFKFKINPVKQIPCFISFEFME